MKQAELMRVAVFEGKHIRKIMHEREWWFSITDIVEVLLVPTVSVGTHQGTLCVPYRRAARPAFPRGAWERCNKIVQLKFAAADGKNRVGLIGKGNEK